MARFVEPKCKVCRGLEVKLFLKGSRCETAKCPMDKEERNTRPGQQGKRRRRLTDYGIHLRETQRAKRTYGVLDRQFTRYFHEASRQSGNTGENLLLALERRLDNIVFRLRLALSRPHARQMIVHGHFSVNGRRVRSPSYWVSGGDVITRASDESTKKAVAESVKTAGRPEIPSWLKLNEDKGEGVVLQLPKAHDIQSAFDPLMIVEYMSR